MSIRRTSLACGVFAACLALASTASAFLDATLYEFESDAPFAYLGTSVDNAGDVNKDGTDDSIVGAPTDAVAISLTGPFGSATVVSGADGSTVLCELTGDSLLDIDMFGTDVAGIGDVNFDTYPDFAVGAPEDDENGANSGSVTIFSGLTCDPITKILGAGASDRFGTCVSSAGDVNGDSVPDMIVGSPGADPSGPLSGSATVISGLTWATLFTFHGDNAGDEFGFACDGAGDVNGDSFGDLVVGARYDDNLALNAGSARVFSGVNGALVYQFNGTGAYDTFGHSVCAAGDVNLDGYDDVIVGAPNDDDFGINSGSATVFSGLTGAPIFTFFGDDPGDQFGWSACGAGDTNGMPHPDVIIGAPHGNTVNGLDTGYAEVYEGATGMLICRSDGDDPGDKFGWDVASAGDVFDMGGLIGANDLVVGIPGFDGAGFHFIPGIDNGKERVFACAPCDDSDGDGYGDPASPLCDFPLLDCDDSDPSIFPGAPEVCNSVDDDCDGYIDEDFGGFPVDVDGDGFTCGPDCDDANPLVNPARPELCNWIDDDCDGAIDEGFDQDTDGFNTCDGDCNDQNPNVNPGAQEIGCNGIDENCNGLDEPCIFPCGTLETTGSGGSSSLIAIGCALVGGIALVRLLYRRRRAA